MEPTCLWWETGEMWESSCKYAFDLLDGTPTDNGMIYCPKCGLKIELAPEEEPTEGGVLMTAQEKWDRMENPKCLADYGLSMSLKEMQSIPAGQAWLKRWVPQQAPTEHSDGQ